MALKFMFNSFDEEQLESTGIASNHSNNVLAWGFIIDWPLLPTIKKIIKSRYLS